MGNGVVVLWFCLAPLAKAAWIQGHLDSPVQLAAYHWLWQGVTLLGLAALCRLLGGRAWRRFLGLLALMLSALLLFDEVYERYFDDLPGCYLITQVGQVGASSASGWELFRTSDLLLVLDVLLLSPWFCRLDHRPPRARLWGLGVLAAPVLSLAAPWYLSAQDRHVLRLRFRNVAAVQSLGLIHYHVYDLAQMASSGSERWWKPDFDAGGLRRRWRQSQASVCEETPWKGRYRGRNLLIFSLESVEARVLGLQVEGQPVTPFLNQLAGRSWCGGLQDQTGQGRSSDGLFIYLNSLLPPGQRPLAFAYPGNTYRGLPAVLNDCGYATCFAQPYWGSFWNVRHMTARYGFSRGWFREQLPLQGAEVVGWSLSDRALVSRLLPLWKQQSRPLFAYTVAMMGHHPYRELRADQEKLRLSPALKNTMLGRYLQGCRQRDAQWQEIVGQLQQQGWWDSSLVVLVGDHDARVPEEEWRLLDDVPLETCGPGQSWARKASRDRVLCLVHSPDEALRGRIAPLAAQWDLAPTLLHLLGAERQPTAMLGTNLLSRHRPTVVVSKGGYGLSREQVMVEGRAYRLHDGTEVAPDGRLSAEMESLQQVCQDVLRLDLVPRMLRFGDGP